MSNEMQLKYGCNPNQKPSRVYMADGSELPIEVLCGKPGYINLLDTFNGCYRYVRSYLIQARISRRRCYRQTSQRRSQKDLLGRRSGRAHSPCKRLRKSKRC